MEGIYRKGQVVHAVHHSTAVHLLESDASVRYVQELLGHESVETLPGIPHYFMRISKIYKCNHPGENECYEEVDETYMNWINTLKERITRQNAMKERRRKNPR